MCVCVCSMVDHRESVCGFVCVCVLRFDERECVCGFVCVRLWDQCEGENLLVCVRGVIYWC